MVIDYDKFTSVFYYVSQVHINGVIFFQVEYQSIINIIYPSEFRSMNHWLVKWPNDQVLNLRPKFTFFRTPRFFCIFRENFTIITSQYDSSLRNSIFLERENSLLLGINFRRRKLIQASVSSKKSFKFWFSKCWCIFHLGRQYLLFLLYNIVIQVVLCVLLKDKHEILS